MSEQDKEAYNKISALNKRDANYRNVSDADGQKQQEYDEHRGAWEDVSKDGREVYTWEEYQVVKEPGETCYTAIWEWGWPLQGGFKNAVDAQKYCEKDSPFRGEEFEQVQEQEQEIQWEVER